VRLEKGARGLNIRNFSGGSLTVGMEGNGKNLEMVQVRELAGSEGDVGRVEKADFWIFVINSQQKWARGRVFHTIYEHKGGG